MTIGPRRDSTFALAIGLARVVRTPWLIEDSKATKSLAAHFQLGSDSLAK